MSSDPSTDAPAAAPDLTGRARIRDAALAAFGTLGFAGASLKVIAEQAGVSQPLIVHHFGSKEGLRAACDEHVRTTIREQKLAAMSEGPQLDTLAALRRATGSRANLRYLTRMLVDGAPGIDELIDELIEDGLVYEAEGIRTGVMKPSRHRRERMVVLVLWQLGLLMLHEQLDRLIGVDLLGEPEQMGPYLLPVVEMFSEGVMAAGLYEHTRQTFEQQERS